MNRLRQFITEIHRRSLWQVLLIYCGAALVAYQAVQALTEGLGLPQWFPAFAIVLFIVGLPIVLATAFVHEVAPPTVQPAEPTPLTEAEAARIEAEAAAVHRATRRRHRFLTWRNAAATFVIVLAAWGVVATGWLLLTDRPDRTIERRSVAVLSFANMSADPENEYFSDGITETIITHLSKIADLKVISRTSIMQYKQTDKNLGQIAEELGVATILEGSVQRAEDRVQITARLVDAASDDLLWAEQYDRELSDVFAIQSDVALRITNALEVELTTSEKERINERPTHSLEAHNLYLLGRYYWNKRTPEALAAAIQHFERAVTIDSRYALGYAGLAECYVVQALYGVYIPEYSAGNPRPVLTEAEAAARMALSLNEQLAEAHVSIALVKLVLHYDWIDAERDFRRAIELNPGSSAAHHWYSAELFRLGRHEEALAEARRALELDPLSLTVNQNLGDALRKARRYEAAISQYERTLELDPDFPGAWLHLWDSFFWSGRYEEAADAAGRWATLTGGDPSLFRRLVALGADYSQTGEPVALPSEIETDHGFSAGALGWLYASAGQREKAMAWLERAYEYRSPELLDLKVDPVYDFLRSDPRFIALLRRVGLEEP